MFVYFIRLEEDHVCLWDKHTDKDRHLCGLPVLSSYRVASPKPFIESSDGCRDKK